MSSSVIKKLRTYKTANVIYNCYQFWQYYIYLNPI